MSISIKEEIISSTPVSQQVAALIDFAEIQSKIAIEVQVSVGEATQKAIDRMDRMTTEVMQRVKAELSGLSQQKAKVLAVEVNGERRKLSQPANPHLGRMLVNAKLGLNTLLVGPAGSGKTIAAKQVAESLGLCLEQLCFTAGASEAWLFGRQTPNGFVEGGFSKAYRNGGVFLADEIDSADANLLMAINTALSSDSFYNPILGETIKKHPNFICIGAANTFGKGADSTYTARNRLDGSTLSRFVPIKVDYCKNIESEVCPDESLREKLQAARDKLRHLKSGEIISTRHLETAFRQKQAGISLKDIFESITAGWQPELAGQCGLVVKEDDDNIESELEKARKENERLRKAKGENV